MLSSISLSFGGPDAQEMFSSALSRSVPAGKAYIWGIKFSSGKCQQAIWPALSHAYCFISSKADIFISIRLTPWGFSSINQELRPGTGVSFISSLNPKSSMILLADKALLIWFTHLYSLIPHYPLPSFLFSKNIKGLVISFIPLIFSCFYAFTHVYSACISTNRYPTASSADPMCP